jgi:hypothetical protein
MEIRLSDNYLLAFDGDLKHAWLILHRTKYMGGLVLFFAKSGPNQGNPFWGCSNYPKCKNIVPIDER